MKLDKKIADTIGNLNKMADGTFEAGMATALYKQFSDDFTNLASQGKPEVEVMQTVWNSIATSALEMIRDAQSKGLIR